MKPIQISLFWLMVTFILAPAHGLSRANDVRAALEAEYAQYARIFEAHPPQTLQEFYDASMNWAPLDSLAAQPGRKHLRTYRESFAASSTASMDVQIEYLEAQPGRAIAVVRKRVSGQFIGSAPYQTGWLDSRITARQIWMPVGTGWKLMTSIPIQAEVTVNGKPFVPDRRIFDPNQAFCAPQDIRNPEPRSRPGSVRTPPPP